MTQPIFKTIKWPLWHRLFWRPWASETRVRDFQAEEARDNAHFWESMDRMRELKRLRAGVTVPVKPVKPGRVPYTSFSPSPPPSAGDSFALHDAAGLLFSMSSPSPAPAFSSGGGGDFGGGGASGSWDSGSSCSSSDSSSSSSSSDSGSCSSSD